MGTLNATPDSFSDGGLHNTIPTAVAYAQEAVKQGADIIDVGGYSTRPGALEITPEEEIERVVPIIKAIRAAKVTIPISIDTFRATVAVAAIEAGANCINDVRALREPGFAAVAKSLGVPIIMMHSRGYDASGDKDYGLDGVLPNVRLELGVQVYAALNVGVRRWNVIVDPGIGFSKTVSGNLELIRNLKKLSVVNGNTSQTSAPTHRISEGAGYPNSLSAHIVAATQGNINPLVQLPVLVGTSRKSYLGAVIGRPDAPAKERDYATLAAVVASIQQGCDIIRIHDVPAGRDAARVSDALYRHQ